MKNTGWIQLHRKIRDNPIYKNSKALHCWIECLLRANHSKGEYFLGRKKIILKEGEFILGRNEFGKSVGISGSTAWFWIKRFNVDRMLDIKKTPKGCLCYIKNWKDYQSVDSNVNITHNLDIKKVEDFNLDNTKKDTMKNNLDNKKTANEQQMNTDNNDNNEDNDNTSLEFFQNSGKDDKTLKKKNTNNKKETDPIEVDSQAVDSQAVDSQAVDSQETISTSDIGSLNNTRPDNKEAVILPVDSQETISTSDIGILNNSRPAPNPTTAPPLPPNQEPPVYKVSDKKCKAVKSPDEINTIMAEFYKFNQMYEFGNKTERRILQKFIDKIGFDNTLSLVQYALSIQGKEFSPTITSAYWLEKNFGKLKVFTMRQQQPKPGCGAGPNFNPNSCGTSDSQTEEEKEKSKQKMNDWINS